MGRVEDYWDKLRLLRIVEQYASGAPQFTQYDIDLARSLGIELNTEATRETPGASNARNLPSH